MLVPEAPMDEDHLASRGKHKVRLTREPAVVKPVPIALGVSEPTHDHLWLRVLTLDRTHYPAAVLGPLSHHWMAILRLGSVSTSSIISL